MTDHIKVLIEEFCSAVFSYGHLQLVNRFRALSGLRSFETAVYSEATQKKEGSWQTELQLIVINYNWILTERHFQRYLIN